MKKLLFVLLMSSVVPVIFGMNERGVHPNLDSAIQNGPHALKNWMINYMEQTPSVDLDTGLLGDNEFFRRAAWYIEINRLDLLYKFTLHNPDDVDKYSLRIVHGMPGGRLDGFINMLIDLSSPHF